MREIQLLQLSNVNIYTAYVQYSTIQYYIKLFHIQSYVGPMYF